MSSIVDGPTNKFAGKLSLKVQQEKLSQLRLHWRQRPPAPFKNERSAYRRVANGGPPKGELWQLRKNSRDSLERFNLRMSVVYTLRIINGVSVHQSPVSLFTAFSCISAREWIITTDISPWLKWTVIMLMNCRIIKTGRAEPDAGH